LKHTAAELNAVPSWNLTPRRSVNVQSFAFFDDHFVASEGRTTVEPGFRPTRLSKIWFVTRNDSPSETNAGSRYVGSDAPAKTSVPAFEAPPAALAATSTTSAARGRASLRMIPLTQT